MARPPRHHAGFALPALLLAVLAHGGIAAQGALVTVNPSGSGDHTSIQAAVDAALPGDRIVVDPGSYPGFTVSKGIAILGRPGAQITTFGSNLETLTIKDVPAGQICAVRGLALGGGAIATLDISDCSGQVVLERVIDSVNSAGIRRINNNSQVVLNRCVLPRLNVTGGSVVMLDSILVGTPGLFGTPALTLYQAVAHISRCSIAAADALVPAAGIFATSSLLHVTGDGSGSIRGGTGNAAGKPAIDGSCVLLLDDDVVLVPSGAAPPTGAGVAMTPATIPSLRVAGESIGATVTVDLFAEHQDVFVLMAGVVGSALPIPAFQGQYWLHPLATVVVLTGNIDATERLTVNYMVPADNAFLGITTGWQAVTSDGGSWTLSNPATATYGM